MFPKFVFGLLLPLHRQHMQSAQLPSLKRVGHSRRSPVALVERQEPVNLSGCEPMGSFHSNSKGMGNTPPSRLTSMDFPLRIAVKTLLSTSSTRLLSLSTNSISRAVNSIGIANRFSPSRLISHAMRRVL